MSLLGKTATGDWPTADQIAQAQSDSEAGGSFDRRWSCFDLSGCDHASPRALVYAGAWVLEICERCGTVTEKNCTHERCEWNEAGTLLRCTTCGVDGT